MTASSQAPSGEGLIVLIARLEAASDGGRELDEAIRQAIGGAVVPLPVAFGRNDGCWVRRFNGEIIEIGSHVDSGTSSADFYLPRYTTSLDAALTLVPDPEHFIWRLEGCKAQLWRNDPRPAIFVDGFAATPALALCIAALRARQAFDKSNSSEGSRTTEDDGA